MRKLMLFIILVIILSACGRSDSVSNNDLVDYDVRQTFDEQTEDEFIFRLSSGKEEYVVGEEVELYGEITYTGDEDITITLAESAVIFILTEQVRDYRISAPMQEIGRFTDLVPLEPYRVDYSQRKAFYSEEDSKDYIDFIKDFKEREGFPPGYYVVEAITAFHDGQVHREIKAQVDFKVLNGEED